MRSEIVHGYQEASLVFILPSEANSALEYSWLCLQTSGRSGGCFSLRGEERGDSMPECSCIFSATTDEGRSALSSHWSARCSKPTAAMEWRLTAKLDERGEKESEKGSDAERGGERDAKRRLVYEACTYFPDRAGRIQWPHHLCEGGCQSYAEAAGWVEASDYFSASYGRWSSFTGAEELAACPVAGERCVASECCCPRRRFSS